METNKSGGGWTPREVRAATAERVAAMNVYVDRIDKLELECAALAEALRAWLKTCRCGGSGFYPVSDDPEADMRPCHTDYCKQARAALALAGVSNA
jgi:hypothetical protein